MYLRNISLRNFRNYLKSGAELSPGVNIIVGGNGAGKSNILEAAQYGCCGRSFRTSREAEMVMVGQGFFRLEAELDNGVQCSRRSVSYEIGGGIKIEENGGPRWIEGAALLSFSPDDLQLVKGPPALRRRFLDDSIAAETPAHQVLARDYQQVLSQRNHFLKRAHAGLVQLADISPWDHQLAVLALKITTARQEYCQRLAPHFQREFADIAGSDYLPEIRLLTQLEDDFGDPEPDTALVRRLQQGWLADMERQGSGTGSHRDDMDITLDGKSLRLFGSQGEQRAAVLSLLLAGRRLARLNRGPEPILLLDDVMSELEPSRRRRLMQTLTEGGGQVLITAADSDLFSEEELGAARVLEVTAGSVSEGLQSLA